MIHLIALRLQKTLSNENSGHFINCSRLNYRSLEHDFWVNRPFKYLILCSPDCSVFHTRSISSESVLRLGSVLHRLPVRERMSQRVRVHVRDRVLVCVHLVGQVAFLHLSRPLLLNLHLPSHVSLSLFVPLHLALPLPLPFDFTRSLFISVLFSLVLAKIFFHLQPVEGRNTHAWTVWDATLSTGTKRIHSARCRGNTGECWWCLVRGMKRRVSQGGTCDLCGNIVVYIFSKRYLRLVISCCV